MSVDKPRLRPMGVIDILDKLGSASYRRDDEGNGAALPQARTITPADESKVD